MNQIWGKKNIAENCKITKLITNCNPIVQHNKKVEIRMGWSNNNENNNI